MCRSMHLDQPCTRDGLEQRIIVAVGINQGARPVTPAALKGESPTPRRRRLPADQTLPRLRVAVGLVLQDASTNQEHHGPPRYARVLVGPCVPEVPPDIHQAETG
jgi:hypothetical protein